MKFTVDFKNKQILIHGSFSRKDIDELFSLLKIEDMDDWTIDKYESTPTWSNPFPQYVPTVPAPMQPYIPTVPAPMQPFYYGGDYTNNIIGGHGTITITDNTTTSTAIIQDGITHTFTNTSGVPLNLAYSLIED